jgi:hypothetical protein
MWCDNPDQWIITTGDHATLQRKVIEESSYTYIYFTYDQANRTFLVQSTHAIPEFPSPVIMLSFMAVAALTTVMHRRKRI